MVRENIAHNLFIIKGDAFSSSEPAIRIFLWFRQLNIGEFYRSCVIDTDLCSSKGAKYSDRCNFACLELAGYMFLPGWLLLPSELICLSLDSLLAEDVFNELTERELREHLNGIALSEHDRERIKKDVQTLLD